ncbi:MAG: hypothetical protein QNJ55_36525 [Xenococcus sp. MO_188.B8]|nr:hypothetical protein [Xenococcus sp. MO_188.B8]
MWENEVLEELHKIREQHAKSFNYDFKVIFADWQRKQVASKSKLVSLEHKQRSNKTLNSTPKKEENYHADYD